MLKDMDTMWLDFRDCNVGRERCRAGLRDGLHRDLYGAVGNGTGVLVTEMQQKDR